MTNPRKPTNEDTLNGELAVSEGRRHLNLTKGERAALAHQRLVEQAAFLFLDLTTDRTWTQIAAELDISLPALKRLTQTAEFMTVYEDALASVGHDPRLQVVTASLPDMLPMAYRRLQRIISDNSSPDGVAMKAIEKLFEWTGANKPGETDDPATLKNFLSQNGVKVEGDLNLIQMVVPDEYREAFARYMGGSSDIVEGAVSTVDSEVPALSETAEAQSHDDEPSVSEVQPEQ